jgi:preprotein translocase subunit SecD
VIGLLANVFTAVFVSKTIFDWELTRPGKEVTALSI